MVNICTYLICSYYTYWGRKDCTLKSKRRNDTYYIGIYQIAYDVIWRRILRQGILRISKAFWVKIQKNQTWNKPRKKSLCKFLQLCILIYLKINLIDLIRSCSYINLHRIRLHLVIYNWAWCIIGKMILENNLHHSVPDCLFNLLAYVSHACNKHICLSYLN